VDFRLVIDSIKWQSVEKKEKKKKKKIKKKKKKMCLEYFNNKLIFLMLSFMTSA